MSKPKLFISHSTSNLPDTDRSVKIKESLKEALGKGWEVLIDSNINPGENWRLEILHNLAESHAGIILFNERAISQSTWVTAEALILCFRKSIDPDFQIIPVLLDGKKLNDTCFDRYEPFQLKEIQYFEDDQSVPDAFAKKISDNLYPDRAKEQPPISPWVRGVIGLLDKDRIEMTYLIQAAECLGLSIQCDLWNRAETDKRNCLCRTVVELMHYKCPLDYIGAINLLLEMLSGSANEFREYLTAKWVENGVIEIILNASRKPEDFRILTINTGRQDVIDEYLKRADIEIPDKDCMTRFFSVGGASGEGDEAILHQIDHAIKTHIVPFPRFNRDGKELPLPEAVAKQLARQNDVAICALPKEFAEDRILAKLRQKYANTRIIFLVQVGDLERDLECFKSLGGIPLRPPLDSNKYDKLYNLKNQLWT